MQKIIVDLHIEADVFIRLYQGRAKTVSVVGRDGRRILFPAAILRRFVSEAGVSGSFLLEIDENMKLQAIHRL